MRSNIVWFSANVQFGTQRKSLSTELSVVEETSSSAGEFLDQ